MKFKKEELWQVKRKMFDTKSWLEGKKGKDLKCQSCGKKYTEESEIGMMTFKKSAKKLNAHICDDCGKEYIKMGAIDINKKHEEFKRKKENLVKNILELREEMGMNEKQLKRRRDFLEKKGFDKPLERLEYILEETTKEFKKFKKIEKVNAQNWVELEDYLVEEYDVIRDKDYLKSEEQIEDYFQDTYRDFFHCGQGIYQDEAEVIININDKFYKVNLYAEVWGAKQNYGEKLYHVESLKKVEFEEIDKPTKKSEKGYELSIKILEEDKSKLEEFLKSIKAEYEFKEEKEN